MELDKFKTMMNVRERMTYFLRFQRMAGSENQVTIDEEAWKLVLPYQWDLSGEHEKAIREGLEIFAHDINSIENKRARKYFIIHYCYMRKKTMSECVEMAATSSTSYHRYKQIAVLNVEI
ncbi:transcriptional regulator [Streptococcus pneumoniae]|nr:transcriptional regulator [Streptococcus pneumoniae]MDS2354994.1 transcriptional regulator [Streptococcus pneumoniae]MDS2467900.1 transcriptional regulator [Streptococcus pneumoniae]MDS2562344.1 transcriptional regulator [Streptococcus pneumoniae]MDS2586695.1 transcriptional regulator [Streptococcus pneumoniae]